MAMPAVGQAAMLAQELRSAVERARPDSLALVGCAGGNGLAELAEYALKRVVCVDVNATYLQTLEARFGAKLRNLECHCCELEQFRSQEPVDLVFAGLVFEYTQLDQALDSVSRLLYHGGSLYALVQMPADGMATVTPSPYADALGVVVEAFRYIPPRTLIEMAAQHNLTLVEQKIITLDSGKSFTLIQFQKS
jgi:SAM-dependent methyltransferase